MSLLTKEQIIKIGQEDYLDFKIDDSNQDTAQKLLWYFNRDQRFEQGGIHSLNKGVILIGPYGTGKTALLLTFQKALRLTNHWLKFKIAPDIQDLASDYEIKGIEVFRSYMSGHFVFDELALKDEDGSNREKVRRYGNLINISQEIVRERYKAFIKNSFLSHFTSNRNAEELEDFLGGMVYTRLMQMCNIIVLNGPNRRAAATLKPILPPQIPQQETEEDKFFKQLEIVIEQLVSEMNTSAIPAIAGMDLIAHMDIARHRYRALYDSLSKMGIYDPAKHIRKQAYEESCKILLSNVSVAELDDKELKEYKFFVLHHEGRQGFDMLKDNSFFRLALGIQKKELVNQFVNQLKEMEIPPEEYIISRLSESDDLLIKSLIMKSQHLFKKKLTA